MSRRMIETVTAARNGGTHGTGRTVRWSGAEADRQYTLQSRNCRRTGRPLAAFTVSSAADDQQCHLDAKIAAYPIRRIRESKARLPFLATSLLATFASPARS